MRTYQNGVTPFHAGKLVMKRNDRSNTINGYCYQDKYQVGVAEIEVKLKSVGGIVSKITFVG